MVQKLCKWKTKGKTLYLRAQKDKLKIQLSQLFPSPTLFRTLIRPLILLMELKRKELTRTLIMNRIQILLIPSFVANTKIRLSLLPLIHQILLFQYLIELMILLFLGTAIFYRVPYPAPTALASSPAPASLTTPYSLFHTSLTTPYILNYSIHP